MPQLKPLLFSCDDAALVGIVELPEPCSRRGVLIVVGGPQYRVGSHRQFTLLSREVAAAGFAVMRFDHRGIGDSEGEYPGFEHLDSDIKAAVDTFFDNVPDLREIVIWGLCDAASAALLYSRVDPRVSGLVLVNPWVRTEQGLARAYMTSYYTARIVSPEFWRKLFSGQVSVLQSAKSFLRNVVLVAFRQKTPTATTDSPQDTLESPEGNFLVRMTDAIRCFDQPILFVLSGQDLTAIEFETYVRGEPSWRRALGRSDIQTFRIVDADHTFSSATWKNAVSAQTVSWLKSW